MNSIYKSLLSISLFILSFVFFNDNANASHVAGGYIRFECTGTAGQFKITLILYRDCSGATLNKQNKKITLKNTCGIGTKPLSLSLSFESIQEVSQVCGANQSNTTCVGGSIHGYQEYIFSAIVTLQPCNSWTAEYDLSARNATVNVPGSASTPFHVKTLMNTQTDNCNTSPTVTSQPQPYVCKGQPTSYNLGAYEPNGDSIVYTLVPAIITNGSSVTYGGTYSATNPIHGATINPQSGTVTFTPDVNGAFIFVIRMTEYDSSGNIVTQTDYEYQTYVMNCNNQQPGVNGGPGSGVTNSSGSIVQVSPTSLKLCQGLQGCFDVVFADSDAGNDISITSNLANVLPGATITQTGTNPLTVHVCWTPTTAAGIVTLNFLVEDDACPIVGQNNFSATISVIVPGVVSISKTTEDCLGDNEGTVTLTVTGGSPPTIYHITGPTNTQNTTGNFLHLPPGTYNYNIETDAEGCPLTGTFTINPGPQVTLTSTFIAVTCNGNSDGSATADPVGNAPYSYVWSKGGTPIGQTTQTASNLTAATYNVTVTDANGCQNAVNVIVTQPTALTGTLNPTNELCNGAATGKINVTGVSGGSTPYQYSIDGGAFSSNANFTGLSAGNHVVKIKDANGCILQLNNNIGEPTVLKLNLDGTGSATCGNNTGDITVSATGGTGTYQFSNGAQTNGTGSFLNMAPGSYTVTVTDANGCTDQLQVTVGAVGAPTVFLDTKTDLQCFGGNNGKAVIGVTGAVDTVSYSLDGATPQASNVFKNLSQGSYTVEILDGNGCTAQVTFTINQPPVLQYNTTHTDASCSGICDGQIVVVATGGTGAYHYSSNNGGTFSLTPILEGLCAGSIQVVVVVKDDNGCQANSNVAIGEPEDLAANFINTDPTCRDGSTGTIQVTNVTGGSPNFQYSVDGGALQPGNTLAGLTAGPHTVVVQDAHGCEFTSTQTLINPPGITIVTDFMNPSNCGFNDGSIDIHGVGGTAPFEYAIADFSGGGPVIPVYQPGGTFSNQLAGSYKTYVRDALGCIDSTFVGINDVEMDGELLDSTNLTCWESNDGTVSVINHAGADPISFELDNSGMTQTGNGNFNGLAAGNHIVIIYDAGNCVFTIPFVLIQPDSIDFNAIITDISCNGGATGEIAIIDTIGGNGNFTFSNDYGFTFQTAPFTGLVEGDYTIMVFDQNYCYASRNFNVAQADPIQFSASVFDLDCHNDGSGGVQVVGVTGGTGSYHYSIDGGPYQPSPTFAGLSAGTYTLTVEDNNVAGCAISMDTIVNQPDTVQATYTPAGTTCFSDCDGQIVVVAQGGTPTYLYSVNGVNFSSNNTIDGLCAGNYIVTVQDDHGCTITSTNQTIVEPDKVVFVADSVVSTCSNANGQINVTSATGGTPGYTYSIDNGTFGGSTNFGGLLAGTYDISVQDSRGCLATGTQEVTDQPAPVITMLEGTDPLCNGDANGGIVVTATGGTGALTYSVDGSTPQAWTTLNGLTAGNHTVTIEDANGCTYSKDIVLNEPTALTLVSTATNLTCYQNSTGKVHVVASGGTPAYQYSFDGGATYGASPNNNFIPAGTYNISVKDAHQCLATGTQIVTEPTQLVFSAITVTDAICKSDCNGQIQLGVSGGTGTYTYTWLQPGLGTADQVTNLCSNTYGFMVTDQNGCIIDSSAFIDEPDSVQITSIVKTNVTCNGDCDGTIVITSPTASEYSKDNGTTFQPASTFNGLCDGDFNIIARDADGCIVKGSANIWQADPMHLVMPNDTIVCNAYNYKEAVSGSGGIQPYTYTWTNTTSTNDTLDIIATTTDTYTLDIFDENGCTVPTGSITVSVLPQVSITVLQDTTICPGGTAILTAQGHDGLTNYDYAWSNSDSTGTISVLPNSTTVYTATVTDQCGDQASANVTVDLHTLPTVTFVGDALTGCIPLTVHFTNTTDPSQVGGNCLWTINGQTFPGCTDLDYTFNSAFCYDVSLQVTSPDGCVNDTTFDNYICVDDYPLADFSYYPEHPTIVNNLVDFTNNSVRANTYNWTFQGQGSSNQMNPSITYKDVNGETVAHVCLEAISKYGCVDTICKDIKFRDEFELFVPNTFTPDPDQFNPIFIPKFPPNSIFQDYHLTIFDRWGEILFESYDPNIGWNGTYGVNSNTPVKDGVYVWKITLNLSGDQDRKEFVGHVTLLR